MLIFTTELLCDIQHVVNFRSSTEIWHRECTTHTANMLTSGREFRQWEWGYICSKEGGAKGRFESTGNKTFTLLVSPLVCITTYSIWMFLRKSRCWILQKSNNQASKTNKQTRKNKEQLTTERQQSLRIMLIFSQAFPACCARCRLNKRSNSIDQQKLAWYVNSIGIVSFTVSA